MDDDGPTASIIFFVALLLIDVFFYGFSAALGLLNEKETARRAEEDKNKKAVKLRKILSGPSEYENAVQLVMILVHVLIGAGPLRMLFLTVSDALLSLAGQGVNGIAADGIRLAAAVLSAIVLLYITLALGVLLPKKIASKIPDRWAYACVGPVYAATRLLSPFAGLVAATVSGVLRLFGIRPEQDEADVTEEEIISMVNEGHEQGLIQASEAEMISNIFEFGDKEAQDIMTHRNSIVAIDAGTVLRDAVLFMLEGKNSRYPVYEENIDHIVGILHLKDAMRFHADDEKMNCPLNRLPGLMREPVFVPQTKHIDELFKQMQAGKLQMVVVVDEYGQTDGLVAMEDILEEIVGNILDEYDEDVKYIEEKGEDEYVMDGKTRLEELEERFGLSFEGENFETLNGFLISRLDKIPEPDEEFDMDYNGFNFKILSVENKMIQSVLVTRLPEGRESGAEAKEGPDA